MNPPMKPGLALLLQISVVLIGIGVLALMLWEPHLEGRNAHASTFEVYFKDPFLAYAYVGSIAFFVGLHRAFGLFGRIRRDRAFSQFTVDALKSIRRCALVLIGFVAGGVVIILVSGDGEDRPAGLFMSMLVALPSSAVAIAAAIGARTLQAGLKPSHAPGA